MLITIREASLNDIDGIQEIFEHIVKAGDTYAYDQETLKKICLSDGLHLLLIVNGGTVLVQQICG
ncbi:hypothetical protein G7092_16215 [Mucilaginibacter sp. HC2]|uniref:hypothetical protein n=1 Tax=Mucilaginibacter inviolabilis TaxID=2714892 RepID=UPI0014091FE7|nr:hypothetical protein [Mucilaginibacter inviolabilis]NHA05355.1 hypothetical protein [Mucilaginibacter inviolabilis]